MIGHVNVNLDLRIQTTFVRDRSTIWNIEKQAVIKYDIKNSFGHQAVIKNQFKYKEILIKRIQKRQ
jgi:hypothetical protein